MDLAINFYIVTTLQVTQIPNSQKLKLRETKMVIHSHKSHFETDWIIWNILVDIREIRVHSHVGNLKDKNIIFKHFDNSYNIWVVL